MSAKRTKCCGIRLINIKLRHKRLVYGYKYHRTVFLNRQAASRYRALESTILGHKRPEKTTICYKISLVQLVTNLNVILYLSTCHTIYISVLMLFMIMP